MQITGDHRDRRVMGPVSCIATLSPDSSLFTALRSTERENRSARADHLAHIWRAVH
jgi:hypothetical protein